MAGEKLLVIYDPKAEPIDFYMTSLDKRGYHISPVVAHGWWKTFIDSQFEPGHRGPMNQELDRMNIEYLQVIADRINLRGPYDGLFMSGEMAVSMRLREGLERKLRKQAMPLLLAKPIWHPDARFEVSGCDLGSSLMDIDQLADAAFTQPIPALDTLVYNPQFYRQVSGALRRK